MIDRSRRGRWWIALSVCGWLPIVLVALGGRFVPRVEAGQTGHELYAQATSAMLAKSFPSTRVEYVLIDAESRETIAMRWAHADAPIPPGSLLKPFVALAYGRARVTSVSSRVVGAGSDREFPHVQCRGTIDGCWRHGGHGSIGLEQALAESCNAYFLALARELSATNQASNQASNEGALQGVATQFGLPVPPAQSTAPMLIGVTPEWRVAPLALARSYAALVDRDESKVSDEDQRLIAARLREGMRMAALPGGTAARIGRHLGGSLAKTGTASCVPAGAVDGHRTPEESCRINGDGLVVVAAPLQHPRWVLLVRERGTTGAAAAEVAGKILAKVEESDGVGR